MTDTVLKGTGNSRTLRTVSNAKTLYPNFDSFLTALINGTFPIDINNLQSSGVSTMGTDLNKPNVLPNATCTALGIATSSVPKDAFNKLATLVKTAQDTADAAQETADNGIVTQRGSYVGTGTSGESNKNSINFSHKWSICVITGTTENYGVLVLFQGSALGYILSGNANLGYISTLYAITSERSVSWYYNYSGASNQFNSYGETYNWFAL